MKNILKILLFTSLYSSVLSSCVSEEDTDIPHLDPAPFYKETFAGNNFSNWVAFSKTGAQVWTFDSKFGNPAECVKITGFSGGSNNANIDWFISPVQNLSGLSAAKLSFDNAYKFTGAPIEVYVSNNYSGAGDPEASGVTWKKINGALLSDGNFDYKNSGDLDISDFTGPANTKVYIAFKYTSTASDGSTWEIDNVKITGN